MKVLEVDNKDIADIAKKIQFELQNQEIAVKYQKNKRFVETYQPIENLGKESSLPWKERGIYLITGGLGGLGFIFANHLAKNYQAKLILTGRSTLDSEKKEAIKALEKSGSEVIYLSGDVADSKTVENWISKAKEKYGEINGIIHSAGIIEDELLVSKPITDFQQVLYPKVKGVINLNRATEQESLDIFILFSSIASCMGNAGQSDYATANAYLDEFAQWRTQHRKDSRTLSINWPLWKEGGMRVDENTENYMKQFLGMDLLPTEEGILALNQSLQQEIAQIIVAYGDKSKLSNLLNNFHHQFQPVSESAEIFLEEANTDELYSQTLDYLKGIVSATLKLPVDQLKEATRFEQYGIDSLVVMNLTRELEKDFGILPKTLFFEYQTLSALTGYFVQQHLVVLQRKFEKKGKGTRDEQLLTKPITNLLQSRLMISPLESSTKIHETVSDIAIIGLSGRYPEANNLNQFWENLKAGKDSVVEIPRERWNYELVYDPDKSKSGKSYGKWGGFINDYDKFDPLFFNISPREAELIDPQERLFLEVAWQTLEDAGYTPERLTQEEGNSAIGHAVGVFVGVMYGQYQLYGAEESLKGNGLALSSSYASIANRVSYYLNLRGPSLAIDTMCSSSLTAIHLACESILRGKCKLALAGGVNIASHPNKYLLLSEGRFLASDGKCKSFGEGGDGYVPGEGVGAVLLKPLKEALQDGDYIYGVIKSSNINHGGRTNNYTVPNPIAQAVLIEEVLREAKVDPDTIGYVEAHGTGTALGDPIEIRGLTKAFSSTKRSIPCAIGSVKSNIGHLESAAGIASITKVLLQMQHQLLVPSLHSEQLNSFINFADTPFRVQHELVEWKCPIVDEDGVSKKYPRRAGVSSFGAGGANAHVILEEAPIIATSVEQPCKPYYLITLSAKTKDSLKQRIIDLDAWLEQRLAKAPSRSINIEAISYTLNIGRCHFNKRYALVASSLEQLKETLQQLKDDQIPENAFINLSDENKLQHQAIFHEVVKHLTEEITKVNQISPVEYRDKLLALANFYTQGYELNWEKLHEGESNRRIPLPAYSFTEKRYWIPGASTGFDAKKPLINTSLEQKSGSYVDKSLSKEEMIRFVLNQLASSNLTVEESAMLLQ